MTGFAFAYAVMHGLWRSATEKTGCAGKVLPARVLASTQNLLMHAEWHCSSEKHLYYISLNRRHSLGQPTALQPSRGWKDSSDGLIHLCLPLNVQDDSGQSHFRCKDITIN